MSVEISAEERERILTLLREELSLDIEKHFSGYGDKDDYRELVLKLGEDRITSVYLD